MEPSDVCNGTELLNDWNIYDDFVRRTKPKQYNDIQFRILTTVFAKLKV